MTAQIKAAPAGWAEIEAESSRLAQIDMNTALQHNVRIVNSVRFPASCLSVLALVISLPGGSLFHVHAASGHAFNHGGGFGVVVHSHVSGTHSRDSHHEDEAGREASFNLPPHDGRSIDLFVSVVDKVAGPYLRVDAHWYTVVPPEAFRPQDTVRFDRTHDPPAPHISPRAPPA